MASKGPRSKLDHETRARRQKVTHIIDSSWIYCVIYLHLLHQFTWHVVLMPAYCHFLWCHAPMEREKREKCCSLYIICNYLMLVKSILHFSFWFWLHYLKLWSHWCRLLKPQGSLEGQKLTGTMSSLRWCGWQRLFSVTIFQIAILLLEIHVKLS